VLSYVQKNGTWTLESKFQSPDAAAGDFFGQAVAIDQKVAAIGAPLANAPGTGSGTAYVFSR